VIMMLILPVLSYASLSEKEFCSIILGQVDNTRTICDATASYDKAQKMGYLDLSKGGQDIGEITIVLDPKKCEPRVSYTNQKTTMIEDKKVQLVGFKFSLVRIKSRQGDTFKPYKSGVIFNENGKTNFENISTYFDTYTLKHIYNNECF